MLKRLYDRLRLLGRGDWLAVAMAAAILAIFAAVYGGVFSLPIKLRLRAGLELHLCRQRRSGLCQADGQAGG
jgi:hypothetical protein